MSLDERVLVVPATDFDHLGRFQGFHPDADRYLRALVVPGRAQFLARRDVEDDPSFKQIIPYVVFRAGTVVFTYARGKAGGEARLRLLRSLGVGGHVAEEDADGVTSLDAYDRALRRELDEEVTLPSGGLGPMTLLGLINDDSNPVGRVHLGVIHLVDLDGPELAPREAALADPEFIAVADLPARRGEFETWSQVAIDALFAPG